MNSWRSISMLPFIIVYTIALLYLNRLSDSFIVKLLPTISLSIVLIYYSLLKKIHLSSYLKKEFNHIYFLILIIIVGIIRSNNPEKSTLSTANSITILILLTLLFITVGLLYSDRYPSKFKKLFFYFNLLPFIIWILLNFCFWLSGINIKESEKVFIGQALLLSKLGFFIDRVRFPLAGGINSYGTVAGMILSITLSYAYISKKIIFWYFFCIVLTASAILLTDSRSGLIYPFVVLIFVYFLNKKKQVKRISLFYLLPIIAPILLFISLQFISSIEAINTLSRSAEDLQTGNARATIWEISLAEFINFKFIHLFGYGEFGHFASGASLLWSSIFGGMENSEMTHPHNTVLMILFDYGYIGLFFYLYALYISFKVIVETWSYSKEFNILILSFLMYHILIGSTESFFGLYYLNSLYIFMSVLILQSIFYIQYKKFCLSMAKFIKTNENYIIQPI